MNNLVQMDNVLPMSSPATRVVTRRTDRVKCLWLMELLIIIKDLLSHRWILQKLQCNNHSCNNSSLPYLSQQTGMNWSRKKRLNNDSPELNKNRKSGEDHPLETQDLESRIQINSMVDLKKSLMLISNLVKSRIALMAWSRAQVKLRWELWKGKTMRMLQIATNSTKTETTQVLPIDSLAIGKLLCRTQML